MISKHKGVIILCDVVNLHLERAEPHNQKLETGNGGHKGFLPSRENQNTYPLSEIENFVRNRFKKQDEQNFKAGITIKEGI